MKKIGRMLIKIIKSIGLFFDKYLINPLTKLILRIMEFVKSFVKSFDRISSKKSTLLIVSLVLAFLTFIFIDRESNVMIDQYAEILYSQPVTAVYNEELYVVEGLPKNVDITLIGQRRHIFLAKQAPSKGVSVDLTGLKPGNHKVTLKYSQRLRSLDYKLDPSQVTVTIYEKISENRTLTYDILHQENLDSKLYISNVEIDRSDVIIKGAQYKLDKVASVKALLDVNNIPNPKAGDIVVKDIPLVAYDTDGKILDVEIVPKTVSANVTITSPSKEVPVKIIPTGNISLGKSIKSIDSSISKITVYGKESAVEKLDQISVKVDVNNLKEDKTFNITLEKPSGITEMSETQINVTIHLDSSDSKIIKDVRIRTENLADNLTVNALSASDSTVDVKVTGSSEAIKDITADNIKAYIDLKNAKIGENKVKVKVTGDDVTLDYEVKTNKTVTVVVMQK